MFIKAGNTFDTGMTTLRSGNPARWVAVKTGNFGDNNLTLTIVMDGLQNERNWRLESVDEGDGTFTYYMSQQRNNAWHWMGAGYGESWEGHEGNPNGKLVLLGIDRAVWSTMDPKNETAECVNGVWSATAEGLPAGTTTVKRSMTSLVPVFNVDTKIPLRDLYKWRIVTKEQLLRTMKHTDFADGLTTNLSYLINDRGFERNDYSFFEGDNNSGWVANRLGGITYTVRGSGRYLYTWGFVEGSSNGSKRLTQWESNGSNGKANYNKNGQGYMEPVRLKAQFDNGKHNGNGFSTTDGFDGKADAKFGYLEFEGVGTVSSYINVPADGAGVYRVAAYGFSQGAHDAYIFATTQDPSTLTAADINNPSVVRISAPFKKVNGYDKNNKNDVKAAGNDFVYNKTDYLRELEIEIPASESKIYFGVVKLEATETQYNRTGYYYDSDWVGADQFDITYLGTGNPLWLDERAQNYLENSNMQEDADYKLRAIRLHRAFELGQWNSFVYPMNLTTLQVRNAFGDGTLEAKLVGSGNLSGSSDFIDFQSIPLPATGTAIKAGEFYIIKPQNNMLTSTEDDPFTESTSDKRTYYNMGNATFKVADLPQEVTVTPYKNDKTNESIYSHATYFNDTQIPAGSYVLGKRKSDEKYNMFYLKSGTTIKGFRGWITDEDAVLNQNAKLISINGVIDETTSIYGLPAVNKRTDDNAVYDLSGRKVADAKSMTRLSKGIYVLNGKKWIVK